MRQAPLSGLLLALFCLSTLTSPALAAPASGVPMTKDGQRFLASPVTHHRLLRLTGAGNYARLQSDFKRVGNLQNDAHITAFIGCEDNGCGVNDALVIYSRDADAFLVMMHQDERPRQFQERGTFKREQYNLALKSAVINFGF